MSSQFIAPSPFKTPYIPKNSRLHRATVDLLGKAAIQINGTSPWDMQLKSAGVPERAFAQGNLGSG